MHPAFQTEIKSYLSMDQETKPSNGPENQILQRTKKSDPSTDQEIRSFNGPRNQILQQTKKSNRSTDQKSTVMCPVF